MHIEDLKRWHWIALSILVGLALSWMYSSTAADGGAGDSRTIGPGDFLRLAGQTDRGDDKVWRPMIRNVTIYPAVTRRIEGREVVNQVVNLEELVVTVDRAAKTRSQIYEPRQFVAEVDY